MSKDRNHVALIEAWNKKFSVHLCNNENTNITYIKHDKVTGQSKLKVEKNYPTETRKREISFRPKEIHHDVSFKQMRNLGTLEFDENFDFKNYILELFSSKGIPLMSVDNFDLTFISKKGNKRCYKLTVLKSPFYINGSSVTLFVKES